MTILIYNKDVERESNREAPVKKNMKGCATMKTEMKPSRTRIERAMAHARAIARPGNYNGTVEVWFSKDRNEFRYIEIVGYGTTISEDDSMVFIDSVEVREK